MEEEDSLKLELTKDNFFCDFNFLLQKICQLAKQMVFAAQLLRCLVRNEANAHLGNQIVFLNVILSSNYFLANQA